MILIIVTFPVGSMKGKQKLVIKVLCTYLKLTELTIDILNDTAMKESSIINTYLDCLNFELSG